SVILDVGHNPHAAAVLRENLGNMGFYRRTFAVVGMLRDKDIRGVFEHLRGRIEVWYVATLDNPRGAQASELAAALQEANAGGDVKLFQSPREAYAAAAAEVLEDDRILVFGSFYTVAEVMQARGLI
ncbi:MAG TPA: bifunctional folylpolyglutamate synthase/dihydrofolate synthase, partial [Burkholderiales bacterium]|nr:bifunctional folylpolyglutamate synthase/dihydrofolate synthase [Burkholderiales bacterium]